MKTAFWLVTLILVCAITAGGQRRKLYYQPEKATVTGRIVYRTFFGPPGYGENPKTDSRETQDILLLDSPVDVIRTTHDDWDGTERRINRITLVLDHSISHFIGKKVVVAGTLFHAYSGHHHTKILMVVSSVKRAQ